MKDYVKLLGFGLIPAIIGYIINYFILILPVSLWLINIVFVIVWIVACNKISVPNKNPILQTLAINVFGFLMLMCVLYQELVLGQYFSNFVGTISQVYFTPALVLGFSLGTIVK